MIREFINHGACTFSEKRVSQLNVENESAPKMTSMVTKLTRGDLCLITEVRGVASDAEAWKKIIGDKSVSPRLQTLPKPNLRWSALLTSTIFQVLLTGLLIVLPAVFPDKLARNKSYEVVPIVAQKRKSRCQLRSRQHTQMLLRHPRPHLYPQRNRSRRRTPRS